MSIGQAAWRVIEHVVLVGLVFLPTFLVVVGIEVQLRAPAGSSWTIGSDFGGAVVMFVGMLPATLGGAINGVLVALLPPGKAGRLRQAGALVLAPIVPATVIIGELSGALALIDFKLATATATVVYGVACCVRHRPRR